MRQFPMLACVAAFGLLTVAAIPAQAQATADGAAIAQKGVNGAPACESCHNAGAGAFPLLANQTSDYLVRQLADFREGRRNHPVMDPIAKKLSDEQIVAVADWYSKQARRWAPAAPADAKLVEAGRDIAMFGKPAADVFPCDTCHGDFGRGGANYPGLAGQNPTYVVEQLKAMAAEKRTNDSAIGVMRSIAKKLTEDDFKAVAAYYTQVKPPAR